MLSVFGRLSQEHASRGTRHVIRALTRSILFTNHPSITVRLKSPKSVSAPEDLSSSCWFKSKVVSSIRGVDVVDGTGTFGSLELGDAVSGT